MMEKSVRSAARKTICRLAQAAEEQNQDSAVYESLTAQLTLAQVALAYPDATLGRCEIDGAPLRFSAGPDGLVIACTAHHEHCWCVALD